MNDVTLREYVVALLGEQEKRHNQRFEGQEKAVSAALAAAKEAVLVAETNSEKWRMNANEWRSAMTDRERQFPTRRELWGYLVGVVWFVAACFGAFAYLAK